VVTSFRASEDFAFDKDAGAPCPHLQRDHRCAIHHRLVEEGFRGCAAYDCHGAGPPATRTLARECFTQREQIDGFAVLERVHELEWLLTEAAQLCPPSQGELAFEIGRAIEKLDAIARGSIHEILRADLDRQEVHAKDLLLGVGDALGGRAGWARRVRAPAATASVVARDVADCGPFDDETTEGSSHADSGASRATGSTSVG
jgi:hypothetical protein